MLDYIGEHIHEGMNTAEIDKIVYDMTTSMGGIPAPVSYTHLDVYKRKAMRCSYTAFLTVTVTALGI